jgi:hypothetical protein
MGFKNEKKANLPYDTGREKELLTAASNYEILSKDNLLSVFQHNIPSAPESLQGMQNQEVKGPPLPRMARHILQARRVQDSLTKTLSQVEAANSARFAPFIDACQMLRYSPDTTKLSNALLKQEDEINSLQELLRIKATEVEDGKRKLEQLNIDVKARKREFKERGARLQINEMEFKDIRRKANKGLAKESKPIEAQLINQLREEEAKVSRLQKDLESAAQEQNFLQLDLNAWETQLGELT